MLRKNSRIALAALQHPETVAEGVDKIAAALKRAASRSVDIICFPETYLPGLRGGGIVLPPPDQDVQVRALNSIRSLARDHRVAVIVGMEWMDRKGLLNLAFVISAKGRVLGHQTKNQITPGGEERHYVPDGKRRVFTVNGMKFGIVIYHEGWRYPETVRWAARRGAQIVFQPQVTWNNKNMKRVRNWGDSFYEKAMICRAQENSIFFASVNTAMRFQASATSLIAPDGKCVAFVPHGREEILVRSIDHTKATRHYAKRYNPQWYQ